MNIVCPPGSYDANVEPAKDDVLFSNSSNILELVETFFRNHYGELEPAEKQTASSKHGNSTPRAFDLLLARKPTTEITEVTTPEAANSDPLASASAQHVETGSIAKLLPEQSPSNIPEQTRAYQSHGPEGSSHSHEDDITLEAQSSPRGTQRGTMQKWHQSMYVEEVGEHLAGSDLAPQSQDTEDEEDFRDITVTNPWTLAKTNAPIRRQKRVDGPSNDLSGNDQLPTPTKGHVDLPQDQSSPLRRSAPSLATPARSQDATSNGQSSPDIFQYPRRAWGRAHRGADTSPHRSSSSEGPEPPSSGPLDTWVRRTPAQPRAADQHLFLSEQDPAPTTTRSSDFVPASILPQGTPLSAIPDISQKPRRKPQRPSNNVMKPFTPPVRDPTRVWFDQHEPSSSPVRSQHPEKSRRGQDVLPAIDLPSDPIVPPSPPSLPSASMHPGLALTMDYEKRKADAISARRAFLRQQPKQQRPQPRPLPS
ncbi:MAG: hypothetical protein Q9211_001967, partial [Gyalolechia sp. 1 TL-2023]